jgi:SNF2 family DNA or RNA helicase
VEAGNFMAMRRVSWDVETDKSTKAPRLSDICEGARDEGRKVIVFSFFLETLNKICAMLGERALGPITGGVSTASRQELIDQFTAAEDGKVLVAQVQAGGVGLNIQSASVVVFAEPQIKPSLESQAVSRAYRMGQVRDVLVHRLLCENTIDERMMQILRSKQEEFDAYAEESVVGTESLKAQSESAWVKEMIEQEKARIAAILEKTEEV